MELGYMFRVSTGMCARLPPVWGRAEMGRETGVSWEFPPTPSSWLVYITREPFYKNSCSNLPLRTCGRPRKGPAKTVMS